MNININVSSRKDFYQKAVSLVSALAPPDNQLSSIEIELLALFMDLPSEYRFYPFSPKARKVVNKWLPKPYSTQNMSIKVCSLLKKKYLTKDEDNFIDFTPELKKIIQATSFNVNIIPKTDSRKNS